VGSCGFIYFKHRLKCILVKYNVIAISRISAQFGTPVHEVGHCLGLFHEQQRSDRDDYVQIMFKDLVGGENEFVKNPFSKDDFLPYDFNSLMHYGPKVRNSHLMLTDTYIQL